MATRAPSVINMMGPRMACTKLLTSFIGCLPRRWARCRRMAGKTFVEHIGTETNQSHWPITEQFTNAQNIQVVQKKENSYRDQNRGSQWKPGRVPGARHNARKLIHRLAQLPTLRRVVRLKGHVENPDGDHHPEQRLQILAHFIVTDNADEKSEDHHMNEALHILAVVDGAHARNETEQEGQSRRSSRVRYSGTRSLRSSVRCRFRRLVGRWFRRREWRRRRRGRRRRRCPCRPVRMLLAVDGSIGWAAACFAQRLSALPAISYGRSLWMIRTIHCWLPSFPPVATAPRCCPAGSWIAPFSETRLNLDHQPQVV